MKIFNKLPKRIKTDRIIDKLSAAYDLRAKNTDFNHRLNHRQWRQGVMRSIRHIDPHGSKAEDRLIPGQLAWRLAPAALALIIVFSIMIIQVDNTIEYQMASLAMSDPMESYLTYNPF